MTQRHRRSSMKGPDPPEITKIVTRQKHKQNHKLTSYYLSKSSLNLNFYLENLPRKSEFRIPAWTVLSSRGHTDSMHVMCTDPVWAGGKVQKQIWEFINISAESEASSYILQLMWIQSSNKQKRRVSNKNRQELSDEACMQIICSDWRI